MKPSVSPNGVPGSGSFRRWIPAVGSPKTFFVLMGMLIVACIAGGFIPQNSEPSSYEAFYGAVGRVIVSLGLDDVFGSAWFLVLLSVSALNLVVCTVHRWETIRRQPGITIAHLAVLLLLAGGAVRGVSALRGTMSLEVGQTAWSFRGTSGEETTLPFSVRLDDFQIRYWDGERHVLHVFRESGNVRDSVLLSTGSFVPLDRAGLKILPLAFYPDFTLEEGGAVSRGEARRNPAWSLEFKNGATTWRQFVFARFPEFRSKSAPSGFRFYYEYIPGRVRQYESRLMVVIEGRTPLERTVNVNSPMTYDGYRFYQAGFDPDNPRLSILHVVKDPSVGWVYAGFFLLIVGLGWVCADRFRNSP
ncbi:MAG TPA: cytochrome c biogenesis protein ResB [Elusimicrobiota bacterium]|nr:cytochrome c biogenesis protein ResB [Elusimicrobiota bacterium]